MSEHPTSFGFGPYLHREHQEINNRLYVLENNGIPGVRDFFATSALSILAGCSYFIKDNDGMPIPSRIATYCYEIADAMMKERAKSVSTD